MFSIVQILDKFRLFHKLATDNSTTKSTKLMKIMKQVASWLFQPCLLEQKMEISNKELVFVARYWQNYLTHHRFNSALLRCMKDYRFITTLFTYICFAFILFEPLEKCRKHWIMGYNYSLIILSTNGKSNLKLKDLPLMTRQLNKNFYIKCQRKTLYYQINLLLSKPYKY